MRTIAIFCLITYFLFPVAGHSALGDHESSVTQDQGKLKAANHILTSTSQYTVHMMSTPTTTVREYVDKNGVVFAVTWNGLAQPDLSVLFGKYYSEYKSKVTSRPRIHGRKPVPVQTSNIVVLRSGHMGDLHGTAFVLGLVPYGVNVGNLQ